MSDYLNNLIRKVGLKTVMRPPNSEKGLRDLCTYIKQNVGPIEKIVEIGSYMGESAVIFAEEFPNTTIICIDPWEGNYDENDTASSANYNEIEQQFDLRAAKYQNIIKYKGYSTDLEIQAPCDVVYIDGCHSYDCVKEDIAIWDKLATKVICGHDYLNDEELKIHKHVAGVRKAVEESLGTPDAFFADTSWLILKK
jgi:hypothetical protein